MKPKATRLVITANDSDDRSFVSFDGAAPDTIVQPKRPVALTDLWHMSAVPTDPNSGGAGPEDRPFTLPPQEGGLVFRIVQFDPITDEEHASIDSRAVFASMNAAAAHVDTSVSPYMHRTHTVDFGIVLEGTMTMLLDEATVDVSAGEIIVQRATNHAWENRSGSRAVVAFVLVDAQKVETA